MEYLSFSFALRLETRSLRTDFDGGLLFWSWIYQRTFDDTMKLAEGVERAKKSPRTAAREPSGVFVTILAN